jgi:CDP-diacylglycerol--serine O-phosphatidyltransferase
MKKHIPNFITLLNLASGVIAILFATQNQLEYAAYFVFLGIVFDFFDGFVARLLHEQSELGVQLDSLADMVTSGVAPGIVMFQLLRNADSDWEMLDYLKNFKEMNFLPFFGILIILAAAYRLANFNIDDRQHNDFVGLPTPALTLFILSLPLISNYGRFEWAMDLVKDHYFLLVVTFLGSILMNSNISLFSLKFSSLSLKENAIKYIFLAIALLLIIMFQVTAIPIIIIVYLLMAMVNNFIGTNKN